MLEDVVRKGVLREEKEDERVNPQMGQGPKNVTNTVTDRP